MGLFSGLRHGKEKSDPANDVKREEADLKGQIDAINRAQAVISFALDGTILEANQNFLSVMGYRLEEIKGKHHSMFMEPSYAKGEAYARFWSKLRRGEFETGEFNRIAKGGREVWLQASYNPIFDADGKLVKVIKFATDITEEKRKNADYQGQIEAIHRSQAIIEFGLDGTILKANDLFLALMGYTWSEIEGKHHSIFVEAGQEKTAAYVEFWKNLGAGNADSRVCKRLGKNGKEVWIQASYNPIFDPSGRPFKVVKFAADLTEAIQQTEMTQHTAQSVAAATEQMSCSIGEISRNIDSSRLVTSEIMSTSTESGQEAARLIESMRSMENIVRMIRAIAGQVNMLALNATIEAARAGEAGRGFAVVANEVKTLSDQTAKATNQIDKEIGAVQSISSKVAKSIQQTLDGVSHVNQYIVSVATAMEEQTSATKEISAHTTSLVSAVEEIMDRTLRRKPNGFNRVGGTRAQNA